MTLPKNGSVIGGGATHLFAHESIISGPIFPVPPLSQGILSARNHSKPLGVLKRRKRKSELQILSSESGIVHTWLSGTLVLAQLPWCASDVGYVEHV